MPSASSCFFRDFDSFQIGFWNGVQTEEKPRNDFFPNGRSLGGFWAKPGGLQGDHKPPLRHHPPGGGGQACGLPEGPLAPPLLLYEASWSGKNQGELFRGFATATRRNLRRTNLELRQGRPAGETSLPEGEIVTIVITNTPLIGGDSSPSTSLSAPAHLQTLVHLL